MKEILTLIRSAETLSRDQAMLLFVCLCVSVGVILIPLLLGALIGVWRSLRKITHTSSSKLWTASLCLLVSVWALRFAVGCYGTWAGAGAASGLNRAEEFFNSFVHALQTFSMDEDYTEYIKTGKDMMRALFAGNKALCGFLVSAYGFWAAVLNAVVPVVGGAIIFQIIAGIFPHIRLRGAYLAVWREKYYFSELNESSLALMKNIRRSYHKKRIKSLFMPVLIVTDAFVDNADEGKSELLQEAKACRAICLRDDITHVIKPCLGGRKFFLMDASDTRNLKTLVHLSQGGNVRYLNRAEILLFTQTDIYAQVEKNVRERLAKATEETFLYRTLLHRLPEDSRLRRAHAIRCQYRMPIITPVKCYRNLVWNLLYKLPLYQPLIGRTYGAGEERELNVVILGTGYIGTEMFLSTYWCGQMLDCRLNITVVSKETREEFKSKINYINPEILETSVLRDEDGNLPPRAEGARNPLLFLSHEEDAEPYAYVQYIQKDINSDGLFEVMERKADENTRLCDADYFLVSLGSDEINLSVADKVREILGRCHLQGKKMTKSVVAYVVYDSDLCATLNQTRRYDYSIAPENDIYMQAIGSLDEVYSEENIQMTTLNPMADRIHDIYLSTKGKEGRREAERMRKKDEYTYWSNVARALHIKYKMFSLDMYRKSVFVSCGEEELDEILDQEERGAQDAYRLTVDIERYTMHDLAWLEHRRWNAFLRSSGFRVTDLYPFYYAKTGSHKYPDLKLHPCLVECDMLGARAKLDRYGSVLCEQIFEETFDGSLDPLDVVSKGIDMASKKQKAAKEAKAETERKEAEARGERIPPKSVPAKPGRLGRWIGQYAVGRKLLRLFYEEESNATYYSDYKLFDYPTEDIPMATEGEGEFVQVFRALFGVRRKKEAEKPAEKRHEKGAPSDEKAKKE